jgi:hypothetical protein
MIRRCTNPNAIEFKHYGQRGISVCDRWRYGEDGETGFRCFMADMGRRPPRLTIERIDTNGNYEPGNCKWATMTEQNRNRRNSVIVEVDGERMHLKELAHRHGVNYGSLHGRMRKKGEPPMVAIAALKG